MLIDKATEDDMELLCDLFNKSRNADASFPSKNFSIAEFMAEVEGEEILVARIGGEVLGFASIWVEDTFLHHLYVSPHHQSKGVGKALLLGCINKFGLPMSLKCIKENTKACRFYEHLGWQATGEASGPEGIYLRYVCK